MTTLGADYSWARPGGAALQAAGVKSVGRYLAPPGDGREIEPDEYADLVAHGISVWFVRETSAQGILGGFAQGVHDAQVSVDNLARLGLSNQVVYAAADFDIQPGQYPAADAYMQGFASVIGPERTGIYGGMAYINHCRDNGIAGWFWKAAASSWDHGQGGAVHIEQTTQTPPVAGSDHNIIYVDNHGQTGSVVQVASTPARRKDVTTLYYQKGSNPNLFALAGDSPGTSANWIETHDQVLAQSWADAHGHACDLQYDARPGVASQWSNLKAFYLQPLKTSTSVSANVQVDSASIKSAVESGIATALAGLSFTTAGTVTKKG